MARQFGGRGRNFNGEQFWARGYAVSTVGFDEAQVRWSCEIKRSWMDAERRVRFELFEGKPRIRTQIFEPEKRLSLAKIQGGIFSVLM